MGIEIHIVTSAFERYYIKYFTVQMVAYTMVHVSSEQCKSVI